MLWIHDPPPPCLWYPKGGVTLFIMRSNLKGGSCTPSVCHLATVAATVPTLGHLGFLSTFSHSLLLSLSLSPSSFYPSSFSPSLFSLSSFSLSPLSLLPPLSLSLLVLSPLSLSRLVFSLSPARSQPEGQIDLVLLQTPDSLFIKLTIHSQFIRFFWSFKL